MTYTIDIVLEAQDKVSADAQAAETALDNLKTKGTDAQTGMENAARGTSKLKDELVGAVAAIGLFTVVDKVGEFMSLGDQVAKTKVAFDELTNPIGEMGDVLADLKTATGGAVTDLVLMSNANMMLKTGLAATGEELVSFTDLAFGLTGSEEGVENFVAAINNMSYERLDTLGISAGAVRDRVNELKEAGLETQEAFKMAVLEEGRKTLERLGEAATAAETPVARLGATFQSAVQNIAADASTGLNALVGLWEIARGVHPIQQAQEQQAEEAAQAFTYEYYEMLAYYLSSASLSDYVNLDADGREWLAGALKDMYAKVLDDPSLLHDQEAFYAAMVPDMPPELKGAFAEAFLAVYDLSEAEAAIEEFNVTWEERQAKIEEIAARAKRSMAGIPTLGQMVEAGEGAAEVYAAQDAISGFTDAFDDLAAMEVPDLLRPEQAQAIADEYERAKEELEGFQALNEKGLISDEQLDSATAMVDQLGEVSAAADKAAEAFANLSLEDVLGQTDGGIAGEVTGLINDYLEAKVNAGSLSQEALDQINQQLALGTGQETTASVNMEEVIAPLIGDIATQLGTDAANLAIERVTTFLQEAALAGLTPDQIAAQMGDVTGFGKDEEGNVTATEGFDFEATMAQALGNADWAAMAADTTTVTENITSLATTDGTLMTETLMLAQEQIAGMVTLTPNLVSDFQAVTPAIIEANAQLAQTTSVITELTSRIHVIKMRVEVDAKQLEAVVKANGGVVPGSLGGR